MPEVFMSGPLQDSRADLKADFAPPENRERSHDIRGILNDDLPR